MIKLATVFSGIGAVEKALEISKIGFEIVFACDNGERELTKNTEEIKKMLKGKTDLEKKKIVEKLYDETKVPNLVKTTYLANYSCSEDKWFEDIRFINGKKHKDEVDLFVGGSPCQSFSTYGKRGGLNDTRGTLFYDYARLIREIKPKVFIYENVTGLLNHDNGRTWLKIRQVFENNKEYDVKYSVLDSKYFGLPQTRKRVYVVGIRNDIPHRPFHFPEIDPNKPLPTIKDFLEKEVEEKYYLGEKGFKYVTEHKRNEGRARVNRDIIGCQTANQQFNWTGDFRLETPTESHKKNPRIFIFKDGDSEKVARKLTPSECLKLMGFENFKIVVNDATMYRQTGNSIAVPVLSAIIEEIKRVGVIDF